MISIHPPLAGRTFFTLVFPVILTFHPPAPCGAGRLWLAFIFCVLYFNPPPLAGRDLRRNSRLEYISIHPPLAGRDQARGLGVSFTAISIHPALAGGTITFPHTSRCRFISIHPPLAGRDAAVSAAQNPIHISIHPPLAGRDTWVAFQHGTPIISIHPPLRAGPVAASHRSFPLPFQSTAPCGAGQPPSSTRPDTGISSTRPLRGGTYIPAPPPQPAQFQSTRPLRGGTISIITYTHIK